MKKQCTKHTYHAYKHLKEEKEEIEDRIEEYNSKRSKMLWLIKDEKENDPSAEVIQFADTFDSVLPELKLDKECEIMLKLPSNKKQDQRVCRYHSHGFCKHGSSCHFYHSHVDCEEHLKEGYCSQRACTDRHRYTCRFYSGSTGCKKEACAYLHRKYKKVQEESDHVKELEVTICKLKLEMKDKESEILSTTKVIKKLKDDLESKEKEIVEKDKIINIIKNTHKSSDNEDEDSDDSTERYVSKADVSDSNSTFDYAQLDLDETDVIHAVKEKQSKNKKKNLQCPQCEYKCTLKNTLKKHINTKHGHTML